VEERGAEGAQAARLALASKFALAVNALRHSEMSVEQITRDVGFQSAPGSSNLFKKHYGMSPTEFRARSH
jgi:transcriptional regulator GlxA family with amidase domain